MKQKCTIFCTTGTADNFLKIANEISARKISKEGDNHDWSSLVYRMEDTRMTINRMDKSAPDNGAPERPPERRVQWANETLKKPQSVA